MATVAANLMTAEEFFEWVHRPENRGQFFELEEGEVVTIPPPGKYHGFVCGNVARILGNFAIKRHKGYVCTNDSGILVESDPDTVRAPDIAFYEDSQTAADMDRKFAASPPLLVVDVLSPHDRINRVLVRVTQLLHRGAKLVWVVDPESRDVSVYRSGKDPQVVSANGELTGDDILPDFQCRVAEFFDIPGQV